MHSRVLMVAALTTGAWVGACSRPASQNDQSASTPGTRQIELVNPPSSGVLASDLEARRTPTPVRSRTIDRPTTQAVSAGQADATPTHDHAMMAATAVVPEVGRTTSSVVEAPLTLAAAPLPVPAPVSAAPTMLVGDAFGAGSGPSAGNDSDPWPGPVSRGPTIIIRGGMGSPVDDCKIHGQGGRGPGLAINRLTPSFGGGEVRGNSGGRFPRGGIR